jgi:hypothetical protein
MTTDVCIYKLVDSRFVEKYDKKVNTSKEYFKIIKLFSYLGIKRHISAFEQKSKIYIGFGEDQNMFILHRKLDKLNLWRFNDSNIDKALLLAEINKKNDSNIISANISNKSNYFAYSDADNCVIFSYDYENNEVKKIKTLKNLSCKFLYFTKDEKQLICLDNANRKLNIYDIKKEIIETISISSMSTSEIILSCDYFENDKEKLLSFSTLNKKIYLINLKKGIVECALPHPDNYITQNRFINNKTLLSVGEDNKFLLIDINSHKFNDWTNKNINNFPKNYLRWYNKVMGVAHQSGDLDSFILYTDYNYIKVDLKKEIPDNSTIFRDKGEKTRNAEWGKKVREFHKGIFNEHYKNMKNTETEIEIFKEESKENGTNKLNFENDNFKITSRFSSILFMDYLSSDANGKVLLVIENDWNKILKEFPETVAKYNYGH